MDPQPQSGRRFWKSPAGISAIAGLLTALVSVGAFAAQVLSDDAPAPSSATGPASQPPGVDGDPAPLDRVTYEDSMADRAVGWQLLAGPDCFMNFAAAGFRIGVDAPQFSHCSISTSFDPALVSLDDVRVEVDASWVTKPAELHDSGYGAAGLRCYGRGRGSQGSYYLAVISDLGWWRISRWELGADGIATESILDEGVYVAAAGWQVGQTVRLGLDCRRTADGVQLALWFDGRSVAVVRDAEPLPPGDVGVAVLEFLGPIEAEFRDLAVLTPAV